MIVEVIKSFDPLIDEILPKMVYVELKDPILDEPENNAYNKGGCSVADKFDQRICQIRTFTSKSISLRVM